MALFRVTNRIIEEWTSIMEADSLEEAIDKFYRQEEPYIDLGQTERPYNQQGLCYGIADGDIQSYCEEVGKTRDLLDEVDWNTIINDYA